MVDMETDSYLYKQFPGSRALFLFALICCFTLTTILQPWCVEVIR